MYYIYICVCVCVYIYILVRKKYGRSKQTHFCSPLALPTTSGTGDVYIILIFASCDVFNNHHSYNTSVAAPQINSPWHHIVPSFITEVLINCEVVLSYRSCMKERKSKWRTKMCLLTSTLCNFYQVL
jgi:hypothetical protein